MNKSTKQCIHIHLDDVLVGEGLVWLIILGVLQQYLQFGVG